MANVFDDARVNILVTGLVQGVFFRASTLEVAQGLNLTGWVKNAADGSVEILAEGTRVALEELVAWSRHGPHGARVDGVILRWSDAKGEFQTFRVVR